MLGCWIPAPRQSCTAPKGGYVNYALIISVMKELRCFAGVFSTRNEGSQGGDDDRKRAWTFGVTFEGLKGLNSPLGAAGAFTDHIQPVMSVIK